MASFPVVKITRTWVRQSSQLLPLGLSFPSLGKSCPTPSGALGKACPGAYPTQLGLPLGAPASRQRRLVLQARAPSTQQSWSRGAHEELPSPSVHVCLVPTISHPAQSTHHLPDPGGSRDHTKLEIRKLRVHRAAILVGALPGKEGLGCQGPGLQCASHPQAGSLTPELCCPQRT